ncbi:MAG: alpha/beta fold hydrolase [Zoogloea sp.]|nr:alpha/beta fold hydrolase [Zoogloea sp.]
MDEMRRLRGRAYETLGWGPIQTQSTVLFSEPGVALRRYGGSGPVLLLVPAPIKQGYIWDLAPYCSVVRQALEGGFRVYLADWLVAGSEADGLEDYADRLLGDCLAAIEAETGESRVFLAGHSLGGTLAVLHAALHPERVRGVVLIGSPLHFSYASNVMTPLVARMAVDRLPSGRVPGSFLNLATQLAAPLSFGWAPWLDKLASRPGSEARDLQRRVERWTLDEFQMPSRLFADVAGRLYRDNEFMRGTLLLGGRRAAPECVSAPLLSVVDPKCSLVPREAVEPFLRASHSSDARMLSYPGDVGVLLQHIGVLVGRSSREGVWPQIFRWMHAHAAAPAAA